MLLRMMRLHIGCGSLHVIRTKSHAFEHRVLRDWDEWIRFRIWWHRIAKEKYSKFGEAVPHATWSKLIWMMRQRRVCIQGLASVRSCSMLVLYVIECLYYYYGFVVVCLPLFIYMRTGMLGTRWGVLCQVTTCVDCDLNEGKGGEGMRIRLDWDCTWNWNLKSSTNDSFLILFIIFIRPNITADVEVYVLHGLAIFIVWTSTLSLHVPSVQFRFSYIRTSTHRAPCSVWCFSVVSFLRRLIFIHTRRTRTQFRSVFPSIHLP